VLPPLDALRCFVEAARLLNFRAASRAVALTPAALGQRIRQLEQIVGQELFTRTTRRVVLTEAGRALLPHARDTLAAAERCLKAGRGELAPEPQELVLGTRHELGMSWLVPLLPRLRARHPGVTFHLYFGSGADLLARVRSLDVHAAIGSMRVADPRIVTLPLHPERYVLVGSPRLLAREVWVQPDPRVDRLWGAVVARRAAVELFDPLQARLGQLERAQLPVAELLGGLQYAKIRRAARRLTVRPRGHQRRP